MMTSLISLLAQQIIRSWNKDKTRLVCQTTKGATQTDEVFHVI